MENNNIEITHTKGYIIADKVLTWKQTPNIALIIGGLVSLHNLNVKNNSLIEVVDDVYGFLATDTYLSRFLGIKERTLQSNKKKIIKLGFVKISKTTYKQSTVYVVNTSCINLYIASNIAEYQKWFDDSKSKSDLKVLNNEHFKAIREQAEKNRITMSNLLQNLKANKSNDEASNNDEANNAEIANHKSQDTRTVINEEITMKKKQIHKDKPEKNLAPEKQDAGLFVSKKQDEEIMNNFKTVYIDYKNGEARTHIMYNAIKRFANENDSWKFTDTDRDYIHSNFSDTTAEDVELVLILIINNYAKIHIGDNKNTFGQLLGGIQGHIYGYHSYDAKEIVLSSYAKSKMRYNIQDDTFFDGFTSLA